MRGSLTRLVINLDIQGWVDKSENKYDNLKCLFGDEVKWTSPFLSLFVGLAFLRRGR